jgi:hypothetical protein
MKTTFKLKGLSEGEKIALEELRNMIPFFLICDGIILIIGGIYGIFAEINFGLFTGILLGNIMGALNFYAIGYASGRLIMRRKENGSKSIAGIAFGMRFFGMFAIYWVLASFGLINLFASLIPLLYPSFYYKFKAIFNKTV